MKTKPPMRAADRYKAAIRDTIRDFLIDLQFLEQPQVMLTIAEGSGELVVFLAKGLSHVDFQPADFDPDTFARVAAHVSAASCKNVRAPLLLDASADVWPVEQVDFVLGVNVIHRLSFSKIEGFFRGVARILPDDACLILCGPFRFSGKFKEQSTRELDTSLRAQNPEWGVRDVDDLRKLGQSVGLELEGTVPLPSNNHCLVFERARRGDVEIS